MTTSTPENTLHLDESAETEGGHQALVSVKRI